MPPKISLWKELQERRVIRVGLVYLAVGWALIEGAELPTRVLALPDFTARLVFALVVLGFPVAIVLAWAYQVTPDGVRRAEPFPVRGRLNVTFLGGIATGVAAARLGPHQPDRGLDRVRGTRQGACAAGRRHPAARAVQLDSRRLPGTAVLRAATVRVRRSPATSAR
jgi:hypothetical protein